MSIPHPGGGGEENQRVLRCGRKSKGRKKENKAGYTATLVACGWAGAVQEKVTGASGQEPKQLRKGFLKGRSNLIDIINLFVHPVDETVIPFFNCSKQKAYMI